MKRRMIKTFICVTMALACLQAALAANFSVSLDRDTMELGETATLSLTFEGGSPSSSPTLDVPGLDITSSGTSQSFSVVNGAMSSVVTITYSVTARNPGRYTIPSLTALVGGQTLVTQPVTLTVLRPNAPSAQDVHSGAEVAFMTLSLPSSKIFVGQELTAQLRIYVRDDVENFGNFQFSSQAADGFSLGKNVQGGHTRVRIGNHDYTVIPVDYNITATRSGPLELGPFTATATVVLPSANQQDADSFFRQFFNQGEQRQVSLATTAIHADCSPLPVVQQPPGYNGAIGDFSMNLNVGPTNVMAGDPVTVRIQISGHGDLDTVQMPDQSGLTGFKIFPPSVKTDYSDALGDSGSKTFEEIVTPQSDRVREWPAFSFSYFNPDDGQYHTLSQPAVPLSVHAAGSTPVPVLAGENPTPTQASPDILPVKESLGTLRLAPAPVFTHPQFWALQALPSLALVAAWFWRRQADSLANNPRRRRHNEVSQKIRMGMEQLGRMASEDRPDDFFATLFRLLQELLGERLDCPASAITENALDDPRLANHAESATRESLRSLFQMCNQARYAPVRGTSELNSVTQQFARVTGEMREAKTWKP